MAAVDRNDDDFWKIALSDTPESNRRFRDDDDSSLDEQHENSSNDGVRDKADRPDHSSQGKLVRYRLPTTTDTLELRSLASESGIWSPLGADAWYASALLASLLLLVPTADKQVDHEHDKRDKSGSTLLRRMLINEHMECKSNWTVLELGSGAVGLSGMACAIAIDRQIQQMNGKINPSDTRTDGEKSSGKSIVDESSIDSSKTALHRHKHHATVFLTDNEPPVLAQLKANVAYNQKLWKDASPIFEQKTQGKSKSMNATDIRVKSLDWNDDPSCIANWQTTDDENEANDFGVDLIIGSELVYTESTALACANLLTQMLDKYPNVHILIVQVMDRYGWEEIFLPKIIQCGASVQPIVLGMDLHDTASTMILPGGTLDQYAYGAVLIHKE